MATIQSNTAAGNTLNQQAAMPGCATITKIVNGYLVGAGNNVWPMKDLIFCADISEVNKALEQLL